MIFFSFRIMLKKRQMKRNERKVLKMCVEKKNLNKNWQNVKCQNGPEYYIGRWRAQWYCYENSVLSTKSSMLFFCHCRRQRRQCIAV